MGQNFHTIKKALSTQGLNIHSKNSNFFLVFGVENYYNLQTSYPLLNQKAAKTSYCKYF